MGTEPFLKFHSGFPNSVLCGSLSAFFSFLILPYAVSCLFFIKSYLCFSVSSHPLPWSLFFSYYSFSRNSLTSDMLIFHTAYSAYNRLLCDFFILLFGMTVLVKLQVLLLFELIGKNWLHFNFHEFLDIQKFLFGKILIFPL